MPENRFLVVIETQKVKDYLFASPILRETRGASHLLDTLNRQATLNMAEKAGGEILYVGGGSGRVLFPARDAAERFRTDLRALYRRKTWNARLSVEVVERRESEPLPEWIARGVGESLKNKLARAEAVPLLGGRWLRPCTSCGREPAEEAPPRDVQGVHLLCRACFFKRNRAQRLFRTTKAGPRDATVLPELSELEQEAPGPVFETLARALQERFPDEPSPFLPWDFDDLGEASRPRGYMGLVYADGNQMGRIVQTMGERFRDDREAFQAYRAFSEIADQATREATVDAVLETLWGARRHDAETDEDRPYLPVELILAGGDDLILAVPAHAALPVALRFLELFQDTSRSLQEDLVRRGTLARPFAAEGLSSSAGVVLAHASYPASLLLEHAAALMKLAKRKAATLDPASLPRPGDRATLDFAVLHESGTAPLPERRRREYTDRNTLQAGREIRRTERPYTRAALAERLQEIRSLKEAGVPRGKLKALYEALFQSPLQAQMESLELQERLRATGALADHPSLARLLEDLPYLPFREDRDGNWTSPLSEIVELYDFVQPGDAAAHSRPQGPDAAPGAGDAA